MTRTLTTQDISWFLDQNEKGQLDLDPPYQRRSVWSPKDRRFFVDTILNNYPAPPVFLHKTLDENGRATYHVVDGKQRIQTIIMFTQDKVRIPEDFSDVHLQKKKWSELERATRERLWNYVLIVEMLPDINEAAIRNTFERINRNSRKLTAQEMRHAKYEGWFITAVESEVEKPEWKEFGVVTAARAKRMADSQFMSELFSVVIQKKISGFDQDDLNELYADYEDLTEIETFVEDDFTSVVTETKSYLKEMLAVDGAMRDFLKVQGNFYSLWSVIALEYASLPAAAALTPLYIQFMRDVTTALADPQALVPGDDDTEESFGKAAVQRYATNLRGASTELPQRSKRHSALLAALGVAGAQPEVAPREDY